MLITLGMVYLVKITLMLPRGDGKKHLTNCWALSQSSLEVTIFQNSFCLFIILLQFIKLLPGTNDNCAKINQLFRHNL